MVFDLDDNHGFHYLMIALDKHLVYFHRSMMLDEDSFLHKDDVLGGIVVLKRSWIDFDMDSIWFLEKIQWIHCEDLILDMDGVLVGILKMNRKTIDLDTMMNVVGDCLDNCVRRIHLLRMVWHHGTSVVRVRNHDHHTMNGIVGENDYTEKYLLGLLRHE
jgi:hypothetical protein